MRYLAPLVILALLAGCSGGAKPSPAPQAGTNPASTDPGPVKSPSAEGQIPDETITSGEFYDAAVALDAAVKQQDGAKFGEFFDLAAIGELAMKNLDVSKDFKEGFLSGFKKGATSNQLAQQIVAAVKEEGGGYDLLRVHKKRGQHYAMFRFNSAQGLNYHDLVLTKNHLGQIRATDFYVMMTGEYMSETLRRMVLPLAANANRNALQKMLQSESDYVKDWPKFQAMQTAQKSNNGQEALRVYRTMSPTMQQEKMVLLTRMMAASQLEDWAENQAAVDDFKRKYPNDAAIDLISCDALLMAKKYDEAQAAIDRIHKSVGGDLYLNVLRSNVSVLANDLPKADEYLRKAATDPKAAVNTYYQLIGVSLQLKDHAKTLQYLLESQERFGLKFQDLTTVAGYEEFVKSPEYQEFLKAQK